MSLELQHSQHGKSQTQNSLADHSLQASGIAQVGSSRAAATEQTLALQTQLLQLSPGSQSAAMAENDSLSMSLDDLVGALLPACTSLNLCC